MKDGGVRQERQNGSGCAARRQTARLATRYLDCLSTACYRFGRNLGRSPRERVSMERDESILNSKDVAQILDLSPDTVNEFARKSIPPAFKKGRQWRFRKRDIAAFERQLREDRAA